MGKFVRDKNKMLHVMYESNNDKETKYYIARSNNIYSVSVIK